MPAIDVHTHMLNKQWLALCIAVGGAEHVIYGSDDPHNIGDGKGCLARVAAPPARQREAVRGANARRIFNL